MLNTWVYLCRTTDHLSIPATDPRNLYTPKQTSFSYLSHAISLLTNHSYELLVDLILCDYSFQICLA